MVHPDHCFLCKAKRGLRIALHRFPKELATRSAWIKFCSLSETTDNVKTLFLCSSHFLPTDYIDPRAIELGNRARLLPKSVPSLGKRKDTKKHKLNRLSDPGEGTSKSIHVPISQPKSVAPEIVLPTPDTLEEGEKTAKIALPKPVALDEREQTPEIALLKHVALEEGERTPKKRRFSEPRYVGDVKSPDVGTPRRAKKCLHIAKKKIYRQASQIKVLKQANRRLLQKVRTLKDLLGHLHNKNLISENCRDNLVEGVPEILNFLINRKTSQRRKYSPELRKFALTLQFYSTAAYNYVRKVWQNLLPHPSTLRDWCSVVNGEPGFTKESFHAIALKNQDQPTILNLVLDEMSIKKEMTFKNDKFYGGLDYGIGIVNNDDEAAKQASSALVMMSVGANVHWKIVQSIYEPSYRALSILYSI